jgi:hypothetical protein
VDVDLEAALAAAAEDAAGGGDVLVVAADGEADARLGHGVLADRGG